MSTTTTGRPVGAKGLSKDDLSLWGSTAIGLSSTAPVYSLTATLGLMTVAVGTHTPAAFLVAFIPILFTAFAYKELNSSDPDCGTTFTWASKAFGKFAGWMGGWGMAVAGVVVLANLAQIAGKYLWLLIDKNLAENLFLTTCTGVAFIAAMTWVNYRGIDVGEKMQQVFVWIQYGALAAFVLFAVGTLATGGATAAEPFSWDWFNPFSVTDFAAFTQAVLLALFVYWGWDTCLALNEETKNPTKTPGRAAVLSSVLLLATYVGVTVIAMMVAGTGTDGTGLANEETSGDVLYSLAGAVMGDWSWLIIIAVLVSAVSSTQTTILPTARGTLSMAVQGALPDRFANVHAKYLTPTFSTILMGVVSAAYFVGMTMISANLLTDSIAALGLYIAFYYGLTGYACVWTFRSTLTASARSLWMRGILPLAGAVMMTIAFAVSAVDMLRPDYGETAFGGIGGTFLIGIGSLAVGAVLMTAWYATAGRRAGTGLTRSSTDN
ncbi:MAG TPA: APC family permease [Arthrobacter sp.]